jgi:hypothetical protein
MALILLTWYLSFSINIVSNEWKAKKNVRILNWYYNVHICTWNSAKVNKVFPYMGCDLVFDIRWPIFKLNIEIIWLTFLTNFKDICTGTVASQALTRISHIWALWPCFLHPDNPYLNLSKKSPKKKQFPGYSVQNSNL